MGMSKSLGTIATTVGFAGGATVRLSDMYAYNANVPSSGAISMSTLGGTYDQRYYNAKRNVFTSCLLYGQSGTYAPYGFMTGDSTTDSYMHRQACAMPDSSVTCAAVTFPAGTGGAVADYSYFVYGAYSNVSVLSYGATDSANARMNSGSFAMYNVANAGSVSWVVQLQPPATGAAVRTCRIGDVAAVGNVAVLAGTVSASPAFQLVRGNAAVTTPALLSNATYAHTGLVVGVKPDANVAYVTRLYADRIRLGARPDGNAIVSFSNASGTNDITYGLDAPTTITPFAANSSVTQLFAFTASAAGVPNATPTITLQPAGAGQYCTLHCLRATPDNGAVISCNTNAPTVLARHSDGNVVTLTLAVPCILVVRLDSTLHVSWSKSFVTKDSGGNVVASSYSTFDVTPGGNVVLAVTPSTGYANLTQKNLASNVTTITESPGYKSCVYLTRLYGANGTQVHGAIMGSKSNVTSDACSSIATDNAEAFAMSWTNNYGSPYSSSITYTFTHTDGNVVAPAFYSSSFQNFQNATVNNAFLTYLGSNTKIVWDSSVVKDAATGVYNGTPNMFVVYDPNASGFWYGGFVNSYFEGGLYLYNEPAPSQKLFIFNGPTRYNMCQFVMGRVMASGKAVLP